MDKLCVITPYPRRKKGGNCPRLKSEWIPKMWLITQSECDQPDSVITNQNNNSIEFRRNHSQSLLSVCAVHVHSTNVI